MGGGSEKIKDLWQDVNLDITGIETLVLLSFLINFDFQTPYLSCMGKKKKVSHQFLLLTCLVNTLYVLLPTLEIRNHGYPGLLISLLN